ncbi:hypothetical protein ACIQAL_09360 [Pseudomonas sp. NPDC088368]|uniref:hypothetical protein n=1 Tax=Pseudomonas sp. NPDC088368 TaxID=3364453 RepID=UPI0037F1E72C
MSPELEHNLFAKYPELLGYQDDSGVYRPRIWGFEHHDGWYTLLDVLCHSIQKRIESCPQPQVSITQVKEKFGELRFYYSGGDEHIAGAVEFAEHLSSRICEECGQPGSKSQIKSWIITRCELHLPK